MIDPTALVAASARIGKGTKIWPYAQIREKARIGRSCVIGNGVYIDHGVNVGNRCNIHNKALLYRNLVIEDDVFIGPAVCFTNDPFPRANRIRNLRGRRTIVKRGASIGANVSILPNLTIGKHVMIGVGSVVTRDVPDYALVYGAPAKVVGFVSSLGKRSSNRNHAGKNHS